MLLLFILAAAYCTSERAIKATENLWLKFVMKPERVVEYCSNFKVTHFVPILLFTSVVSSAVNGMIYDDSKKKKGNFVFGISNIYGMKLFTRLGLN